MDQSEKKMNQPLNENNSINDKHITENVQINHINDQLKDNQDLDKNEQINKKSSTVSGNSKEIMQYINLFLNFPYSSVAFIGCGVIFLILSYFFPYMNYQETGVLKIITVADFVDLFGSKAKLVFLFFLYPYPFAVLIIHLTIFVKKITHIKWLRFPLLILNWSGFLFIFYSYFGFYFMSPRKEGWDAIIGFLLVGIMLLTYHYLYRLIKLQPHSSSKTIYLAIRGAFLNIIGFIIVMITIRYGKTSNILTGAYLAIIGSVLIFLGLLLYLYYAKANNQNWFIAIADEKKYKKSGVISRLIRKIISLLTKEKKTEAAKAEIKATEDASQSKSA